VWAFSYLFKSVIDFVFQNPHPRAVAGDVWKG